MRPRRISSLVTDPATFILRPTSRCVSSRAVAAANKPSACQQGQCSQQHNVERGRLRHNRQRGRLLPVEQHLVELIQTHGRSARRQFIPDVVPRSGIPGPEPQFRLSLRTQRIPNGVTLHDDVAGTGGQRVAPGSLASRWLVPERSPANPVVPN